MRKGNLKRFMALTMSTAMTAAAICGCGAEKTSNEGGSTTTVSQDSANNKEEAKPSTESNSLFNEPGTLPIVNEPITLTVFAPANGENRWEDNRVFKSLSSFEVYEIIVYCNPLNLQIKV